jgi:hypothetical protein
VSLLDNGPDTITVYAEAESTDDYRNRVLGPSGSGVIVRGRWQPGVAEESAAQGQETTTLYRFLCRDFPAGPYAKVTFDGADWDVVGEPKKHRGSAATRHTTVLLRER